MPTARATLRATYAQCALVATLLLAGVPATHASDRTRFVDPPAPVPEFTLVDQQGRPFTAGDLRGRVGLVFFGFTNCMGICPATLQVLRQATHELGPDASDLRVVLVSVDPARDTPAAMQAFLEPFGPGFLGLTGEPADLRKVADGFGAVYFNGMPRPAGGYDVEHTSQVYLVDRDGRLRAIFQGAGSAEIAAVARPVLQETAR
jgi:protein SCO1/2